ncbi:MAG: BlaI/MecI/CopY family transcriptional regulator [Acidobacteria bacterium]|nr:BlaI/MecI/CopY family transcriptional regulator [Acidobacteriota bacterium]
MSRSKPTASEWAILNALWERGPATVRGVHDVIAAASGTTYNTTLKLMQIMAVKGLVKRDASERAHVYKPAFAREALQSDAAVDLLDRVFAGSAAELMQRALARRKPNAGELAKLRELLQTYEKD